MGTNCRRRLLTSIAMSLLAACEGAQPSPRGAALPPPRTSGSWEPAPMPSDVTDDYLARRRAATTPASTGPDAMPGFDPAQRIGTDVITAPVPHPLPR